jgi:catechol 2,3-dioxygenase-like lactoylglutathione lyase family enzyme
MTQQQYNVGGVMFAQPFKAVRLGHLALWTRNTPAGEKQLLDTFGLYQTDRLVGKGGELLGCFTTCNTDHHAMVVVNPETADPERRAYYEAGGTLNQLSFQVNSLREINEAHRFFIQHGCKIQRIGRDEPGSNSAVYAYDPDGHRVELFYGMEQIGWQGKAKPAAMYSHAPYTEFNLPRQPEVQEVWQARDKGIDLLSGQGGISGLPFKYDVGGIQLQRPFKVSAMGPVRLFCSDFAASERFYKDIIGLTPSDEITYEGHRCVFLRAGSEHHSVALMPLALRAKLGFSDQSFLMSFGMRVQTYQQLRDARQFLLDAGLKQVELPAQLNPGIGHVLHFMFDDIHCVQLYFEMAHFASDSTAAPQGGWPETLQGSASTYATQLRLGPLG